MFPEVLLPLLLAAVGIIVVGCVSLFVCYRQSRSQLTNSKVGFKTNIDLNNMQVRNKKGQNESNNKCLPAKRKPKIDRMKYI